MHIFITIIYGLVQVKRTPLDKHSHENGWHHSRRTPPKCSSFSSHRFLSYFERGNRQHPIEHKTPNGSCIRCYGQPAASFRWAVLPKPLLPHTCQFRQIRLSTMPDSRFSRSAVEVWLGLPEMT